MPHGDNMETQTETGTLISKTELKIPSDLRVVKVESLWKVIASLRQAGDKMEIDFVTEKDNFSPTEKGGMNRILSYLKYLGLLSESRESKTVDGKKINLQYFYISDDARKLSSKMALGREDEVNGIWAKILRNSTLYIVLSTYYLEKYGEITKYGLESLIEEAYEHKLRPEQIKDGAQFIIDLFKSKGVLEYDASAEALRLPTDNIEAPTETEEKGKIIEGTRKEITGEIPKNIPKNQERRMEEIRGVKIMDWRPEIYIEVLPCEKSIKLLENLLNIIKIELEHTNENSKAQENSNQTISENTP